MQSSEIIKQQLLLSRQLDSICDLRVEIIKLAIERTRSYLSVLNQFDSDMAKSFLKLQRKVVLAQPNVMDGCVEGKDFLPPRRHAFPGVPMPRTQIVGSIEIEKKQCLNYIAKSLLPVKISIDTAMIASQDIIIKPSLITINTAVEYIKRVLLTFMSFGYYQKTLQPISAYLTKAVEIPVKDLKLPLATDGQAIDIFLENILLFDCLYVNKCKLLDSNLLSDCSDVKSNLLSIQTGEKLDKLTAIEFAKPLKDTLVQMYSMSVPNKDLDSRQAS